MFPSCMIFSGVFLFSVLVCAYPLENVHILLYNFETDCFIHPWLLLHRYDFDTQYAFVGDYSGQITLLKLEQSTCSVITTLKGHEGRLCDHCCFSPNVCARVPAQSLQSCPTLCNPMDCSSRGSSVHGDSPGKNTGVGCHALLQGFSWCRGRTQVSCVSRIGRWFPYHWCHLGSPLHLIWASRSRFRLCGFMIH